MDVTSLCTKVPHNEGISAIKEMLGSHRQPLDLPHSSYIVELLTVVLTNNYFEFNGAPYHQVSGTAMGTNLSLSYANLFMTKCEENMYTYILYNPKNGKGFLMTFS